MEGKKASCMLQFKSDAKLSSEEFVKVFKEFDKDGKIIFDIIRKMHWIQIDQLTFGNLFSVSLLLVGNGYIEADELTDFLVILLRETGNEVR